MSTTRREFLLEIGCEEIPAWMVTDALTHLVEAFTTRTTDLHLPPVDPAVFATPRRLVLRAELPERQPDRDELLVGPPASAGVGPDGAFTPAALGFARKQGGSAAALRVETTPKGDYVVLARTVAGQPAPEILAGLLPTLIRGIPFPKTMYWLPDRFRFVRPIRRLLAVFDGRPVPFEVAGVIAGAHTFGHRFLGAADLPAASWAEYRSRLAENGVLVDPGERRARIESQLATEALAASLRLRPDPGLVDEAVYLHEFPTVITGSFDPTFRELPEEVLVTVMRKHQKYFPLEDDSGRLAPRFLAVINTRGDADGRIRTGHERVLKARLVDAAFFWRQDRRTPLSTFAARLDAVRFHEALGSYGEKTTRLQRLIGRLADSVGLGPADRKALGQAASLCKADLVTEMVKELTELQGVMGGRYAEAEGLPEMTWRAIYEHHRPEGADDPVPTSLGGALLALADKADSLAGLLGLGLMPTGSRDPFGLRRLATGLYRIVLERDLDMDLEALFLDALEGLADKTRPDPDVFRANLTEFLGGRIRHLFQAAGFRYDEIAAVLDRAIFHPADARRRLDALLAIRQVEAFRSIFTAKKRIRNILSKQDGPVGDRVDPTRLQQDEERHLHQLVQELAPQLTDALSAGRYGEAIDRIGQLAAPVDAFFDAVLVMHEDPPTRTNRIALLWEVERLFDGLCDFSRFVVEGS